LLDNVLVGVGASFVGTWDAVKAIGKGAVGVAEFGYDLAFNPDQASQKWVKAVSAVEGGAEAVSSAYSMAEFIAADPQARAYAQDVLGSEAGNWGASEYAPVVGMVIGEAAIGIATGGAASAAKGAKLSEFFGSVSKAFSGGPVDSEKFRRAMNIDHQVPYRVDELELRVPARINVQQRMNELELQGHGVQRHGPNITEQQLIDRVVLGHDPMTGTAVDGVHGGAHGYAAHATKVNTPEAYVYAEDYARNSQQFSDAVAAATVPRIEVQVPLKDLYGDNFREYVTGVSRYGAKSAPAGYGHTTFSDNAYMAVRYKQDASGAWVFNTMFPQPN
jgi:hypothetical protein